MTSKQQYVEWFRNSAPYINAHRGETFVIQFGGEVVRDAMFPNLIHDLALLESLGVKLVLVHGVRPQVERRLSARGLAPLYAGDIRVTDEAALEVVKEATGSVRLEIEALLSMGLANSPMAGARIRVTSGNFVTARPIGVRGGIDYCHTGQVRRIDSASIYRHLDNREVVIISPIGFSPTGEMFNLPAEEVATVVAVALKAGKLIFIGETASLTDAHGCVIRQLTLDEATSLHAERRALAAAAEDESLRHLDNAVRACRNGVRRTHILDRHLDGALISELFTRDGVGTMVNADLYEDTRAATIDDVGGILELIGPLEDDGTLVKRSREKLETEIDRFLVMERDGAVIACAGLYPLSKGGDIELACLVVHKDYRDAGRGEMLLRRAEQQARSLAGRRLFVLTTRTTHWFRECGFESASVDDLPAERKALYNYTRNSKILYKALG